MGRHFGVGAFSQGVGGEELVEEKGWSIEQVFPQQAAAAGTHGGRLGSTEHGERDDNDRG